MGETISPSSSTTGFWFIRRSKWLAEGEMKNPTGHGASDLSEQESNLDNYIAGYNKSCFVSYPDSETDELLNAYLHGYNLGIIG